MDGVIFHLISVGGNIYLVDPAIHDDGVLVIVIIHISCIVNNDVRSGMADPPLAMPAMVKHLMMVPIHITVQPHTDQQTVPERHDGGDIVMPFFPIHHLAVILRHVDEFRLHRNDPDLIVV